MNSPASRWCTASINIRQRLHIVHCYEAAMDDTRESLKVVKSSQVVFLESPRAKIEQILHPERVQGGGG